MKIRERNEDSTFGDFVDIEKFLDSLDGIKKFKISELSDAKDAEVLAGFASSANGTSIGFGYNQYDQEYLHKKATMLTIDPTITSINWKTEIGFVTFTRDEFIQIIKDAEAHEETLVYKLMNLEALVLNAATKDDVNAIVW